MRKFYTTSIILLSFILTKAQSVSYDWVKTIGNTTSDAGICIALDDSGYVYSTGVFSGTVDFDPDTGIFNLASTGFGQDIYISKSDTSGNLIWAKKIGGPLNDQANIIKLDSSGNIYLAGSFSDTADFDPDTGIYNLAASGSFDLEIFVCKLNASGNLVWAKKMGGIEYEIARSLAVDDLGNVYTTGYFEGTADFDPDTGVVNLVNGFVPDIFIQKLDMNGNFVWVKQIGGSNYDMGYSIALDDSGNIFTTGQFMGTTDFDPDTGVFNMTSAGSGDFFIHKMDPSGSFVWAKRIGGIGNDIAYAMIIDDANNIFITGSYSNTADFDPDTGVFNMTSQINFGFTPDIFVEKLNSAGNFIWAKSMGGDGTDEPSSIDLDAEGNIYTTGTFSGNADFNPDPSINPLTNASGFSNDIFISSLDSSGNFRWIKSIGESFNDECYSVKVNNSGKVYTTGSFTGSVDFDPGSDTVIKSSIGIFVSDIFLHKMKPCSGINSDTISVSGCDLLSLNGYDYIESGTYLQVLTNAGGCDSLLTVNVDLNLSEETWTFPEVCDSLTVNGTTYTTSGFYTQTYTNVSGCDSIENIILFVSYSVETNISYTACNSYTYNGTTYTTTGVYPHNFVTTFNCDSIVNLNLTINNSPVAAVTQTGFTLFCTNVGATYQWINCAGNVPIAGQTGQNFTATANGNYAVIVTQNGCKDTSACVNITGIGIEETWSGNILNVFPNPSNGQVNITFNNDVNHVSVKILNTLGKVVFEKHEISGKQFAIDISEQAQGIYFMELNDGKNTARIKLFKN